MKTSLKNPCLECDHHLQGGSKNGEKCKNCDKRLEYIDAIDTSRSSSVSEHVDLEGHGGSDLKKSVKDNVLVDAMKNTAIEDLTDQDPIEEYIKQTCEAAGITPEKLRSGIATKSKRYNLQAFQKIRDQIIKQLASGKFGELNQTIIGKYLGVSNHVISSRMVKMKINPRGHVSKKTPKHKPAPPAKTPPDKRMITLAFDDHPELYNDLLELSRERLRTIENQVLFILLQVQKRGMRMENTQP